jgi:hypothetical protein
MRWIRVVGACSVAAGLLLAATAARAQTCADRPQPTPADRETARTLMADAREMRERGDNAGAAEKFKAADAIMKVPTTGLETARTLAALGKLVEARDVLAAVARIPTCPDDPAPFAEARNAARKLDEDLAPRIPAIRIAVKGAPPGAATEVKVDDVAVPEAALAAPRRVNPGRHVVTVRAGNTEGSQQVDVAEREVKDVAVEVHATSGGGGGGPIEVKPSGGFISKPVAFAALGVGGVGIVVGAITGIMAMGAKSDAEKGCVNNKCPPATYSDLDKAQSMATVSTVAFIIGGVGVAVGVVGLLTQPKGDAPKEAPKEKGASVSPWIGLGSAGLSGSF